MIGVADCRVRAPNGNRAVFIQLAHKVCVENHPGRVEVAFRVASSPFHRGFELEMGTHFGSK